MIFWIDDQLKAPEQNSIFVFLKEHLASFNWIDLGLFA